MLITNCFNYNAGWPIGFDSNLTDAVSLFEKIEKLPVSDTLVLKHQTSYLRNIFLHLYRRRSTFNYLSKLSRVFDHHLRGLWRGRPLIIGHRNHLEFRAKVHIGPDFKGLKWEQEVLNVRTGKAKQEDRPGSQRDCLRWTCRVICHREEEGSSLVKVDV